MTATVTTDAKHETTTVRIAPHTPEPYRRRPMRRCVGCGCLYDDAGHVCADCAFAGVRDTGDMR